MQQKNLSFHPRRTDREIKDLDEIQGIIASQKYMTIALCKSDEPYLVTLSYGYDPSGNCFFFHCALEGKKIDMLKENPIVWGQIIQDRGYMPGKCSHAYSSVDFKGTVTFLESNDDKASALSIMIDQLDPDPEPVKQDKVIGKDLANVLVGRIDVDMFSGKKAH
ncbi:MAG TPA: pyridoxamine 5'-phosphate oxidase family protein [Candidatus Lokiarchaeia archaeon]|nr:pyridoxamine 5'-phosphate oxidase family protein [Candidatus Lokiarchaeia archaeon]